MAKALQATVYASDGAEQGSVDLDADIFGVEPNTAVMHQVVTAQLAARRSGSANTKTRSDVRGGGRKPWRQKGLGRARHGSIRSPQWRGGGVVFGPRPRDFSQRTPKKMKRLALTGALSARASENAVKVIDEFDWEEPRTRRAVDLLDAIEAGRRSLLVLGGSDLQARKSFRNLPQVTVVSNGQLSTYDVMRADTVIFTKEMLEALSSGRYDVRDSDFVPEPVASKSKEELQDPPPPQAGEEEESSEK